MHETSIPMRFNVSKRFLLIVETAASDYSNSPALSSPIGMNAHAMNNVIIEKQIGLISVVNCLLIDADFRQDLPISNSIISVNINDIIIRNCNRYLELILISMSIVFQ